ncbi:hypothetical protein PHMEG_00028288 [Phytophthora megakarya]|uniref:Reverse transcriptase domain-containing protein n=1 Tax=Phytophthora megakarya TaxID=4795 RepID=A0A225V5V8_9STRA|nr:hypothetical protein PHMEG_00028288 [Phytophthora megakarya]
MARNRSPNPRPRQQRRRREDDTAADSAAETENGEQAPTDGNSRPAASHPTPPSAEDTMAMMRQMFEYMNTTQRQNQEQMSQMLQQQVLLQQQMLQAHVAAQKPQKKKGNPPRFNGETNDDLELLLFSTEEYYSNYSEEMQCESCIRESFREADYQHKLLSRLHNLRWSGSQHSYTTKFLHLLSQLDSELPESVKRWYYQQNLRPETNAFVSQNVPSTLKEVIELADRYEDSRASQPGNAKKDQSTNAKPQGKQRTQKKNSSASNKFQTSANTAGKNSDRPMCEYCDKPGNHKRISFQKKTDAKASAAKTCPLQAGLYYHTGEASNRKKEKHYGFLCHGARVDGASVSVFIDSGASFNAMAPEVAANLQQPVTMLPEPLRVKLGGGQRVSIPRRTATITLSMDGFHEYDTKVFVMEIPEGETRRRAPTCRHRNDQLDNLLFYAKDDYMSSAGETKVISHRQFRCMQHDDDTFCFTVRICEETSGKAARQLRQGWDKLRCRPEEAVVVKNKNTVFRAELPNVAPRRSVDVEAEVELSDDTPVARKQFRLSDAMKVAIRAWTLEMLKAGIIRPSKSPYCAPTFCVKKAVGWRIVHDFRGINSKLRVPVTSVPRKEDIFDAMAGGYYFSAMDLLWGFFQVRLREKDIQYTAFSTPDGQFEYLVTPMRLACSPSAFNRMMQRVFSDQHSFCRAYFDDLFVFTKPPSLEIHLDALDKVLKRCEEQQLYIKLEKCTFCASEIPCLGDFFGRDGNRMDADKSRVSREWPLPCTRPQLQSFVGTCSTC